MINIVKKNNEARFINIQMEFNFFKKLLATPILLGLVALCIFFGVLDSTFLSFSNISNILLQSTPVALVAVGMTFVILSGNIDLSVGSIVALSGVTFGLTYHHEQSIFIAVVVALVTGISTGLINGLVIAKAKVPSFVATLGMMSIARGGALWLTDGRSVSDFPNELLSFANATLLGLPVPGLLMIFSFFLGYIFLKHTVWGRRLTATGTNPRAAWLCGISVSIYTVFVFAISGMFSGIAAVVLTARLNSAHPLAGSLYELDAIAAVVIGGGSFNGGKATMIGTLTGSLIIAVIRNGLSILNVTSYLQQIAIGLLIVAAVAIDYRKSLTLDSKN